MGETTAAAAPTGNLDITVSRAELLRELTAAQSVVERKTTIPILSNFLFEAAAGDGDPGKLTITATDLDQSLRTSCAAKVKKAGACTIPARKLYAPAARTRRWSGWRGRTSRRFLSFRRAARSSCRFPL
jgi:DNA polymerase-3 subunit beta